MFPFYVMLVVLSPFPVALTWSYILPFCQIDAFVIERKDEKFKCWRDDDAHFTRMLNEVKQAPVPDIHHSIYRGEKDDPLFRNSRNGADRTCRTEPWHSFVTPVPRAVQASPKR